MIRSRQLVDGIPCRAKQGAEALRLLRNRASEAAKRGEPLPSCEILGVLDVVIAVLEEYAVRRGSEAVTIRAEIAIMTCPREPSYLGQLLRSLHEHTDLNDVSVRAVVDAVCEDHGDVFDRQALDIGWAHSLAFEWLAEPPTEPLGDQRRILRTFRRCVDGAVAGQPLIVLQDDAVVAHDWLDKALAFYDRLKEENPNASDFAGYSAEAMDIVGEFAPEPVGGAFFVALFSGYRYYQKSDKLPTIKPEEFYGNVGLLLPANILKKLSNFLGTVKDDTPDDIALREFAIVHSLRIYDMVPNVVQHIGERSTRPDEHVHRKSPTFDE